jgi:hypothetical protein
MSVIEMYKTNQSLNVLNIVGAKKPVSNKHSGKMVTRGVPAQGYDNGSSRRLAAGYPEE